VELSVGRQLVCLEHVPLLLIDFVRRFI